MKTLNIYIDLSNEGFYVAEYNGEEAHSLGFRKGLRDTVYEALSAWGLFLDDVIVLVENDDYEMVRYSE